MAGSQNTDDSMRNAPGDGWDVVRRLGVHLAPLWPVVFLIALCIAFGSPAGVVSILALVVAFLMLLVPLRIWLKSGRQRRTGLAAAETDEGDAAQGSVPRESDVAESDNANCLRGTVWGPMGLLVWVFRASVAGVLALAVTVAALTTIRVGAYALLVWGAAFAVLKVWFARRRMGTSWYPGRHWVLTLVLCAFAGAVVFSGLNWFVGQGRDPPLVVQPGLSDLDGLVTGWRFDHLRAFEKTRPPFGLPFDVVGSFDGVVFGPSWWDMEGRRLLLGYGACDAIQVVEVTRPGEGTVNVTTPWVRLDGNYACPSGVDKLWASSWPSTNPSSSNRSAVTHLTSAGIEQAEVAPGCGRLALCGSSSPSWGGKSRMCLLSGWHRLGFASCSVLAPAPKRLRGH